MDRGLLAPRLQSKAVLAFSLNDMVLTADGVSVGARVSPLSCPQSFTILHVALPPEFDPQAPRK